jgi:hypothetical protein
MTNVGARHRHCLGPSRPSSSQSRGIRGSDVPRIAHIISQTFDVDIDKNVVYRVLAQHYGPVPGGTGPSWLSVIGHMRDSLWSVDVTRYEFPGECSSLKACRKPGSGAPQLFRLHEDPNSDRWNRNCVVV